MTSHTITVTADAQEYLRELLAKQNTEGIGVRIFVERPGTPYAQCCMAFCPAGEEEEGEQKLQYEGFHAWIDGNNLPYVDDAVIEFKKDSMGGQLSFRAPRSPV